MEYSNGSCGSVAVPSRCHNSLYSKMRSEPQNRKIKMVKQDSSGTNSGKYKRKAALLEGLKIVIIKIE